MTETRTPDGTITALAVACHRIAAGQIVEQIADWTDDDPAPARRSTWATTGLPDRG